jgi:hypothetical protein
MDHDGAFTKIEFVFTQNLLQLREEIGLSAPRDSIQSDDGGLDSRHNRDLLSFMDWRG